MAAFIDLTGQTFGNLTVVSRHEENHNTSAQWHCRCECGGTTVALSYDLRSGAHRSCGCTRNAATVARNLRHGRRRDPEYKIWLGIVQRCTNPKNAAWPRYGGRGITICPEWRESYVAFITDMDRRPAGATIDRKDNDLGYSRDNCKWATRKEQNNNKRNNRIVNYRGQSMTLAMAETFSPVTHAAIWRRLDKGWSVEQAIETPALGKAQP